MVAYRELFVGLLFQGRLQFKRYAKRQDSCGLEAISPGYVRGQFGSLRTSPLLMAFSPKQKRARLQQALFENLDRRVSAFRSSAISQTSR
ncbi:hypothetical protein SAMN04488557_1451 [Hyphomicrobium facile]|uniref:Uncharacterized protein n=1 Tax=Hyphomicrobium facile TaxID=51670 RepID=A0A1I7NBA9_9HYPH|nr:hypothetical protein SAMN04488557_1451 [Hyphomicrobium facile]